MNLIEEAKKIATKVHTGQMRKTDGSPYINHPITVAEILEQHGFSEEVVAAALVHDVLEDTAVTEAELRSQLGDAIVDIVMAVSEDKSLPWEVRKQQYIEQVVAASESVKAVSVADKIHNAQSLIKFHAVAGSDAWEKFSRPREQKFWFERELCSRLKAVWQHPLLDEYDRLVTQLETLD